MSLLSLDEARTRLLSLAEPCPVEHRQVDECLGYFLAQPLLAARSQPSADLSAMDGYAVGGPEGPWTVIGESAAGHPFLSEISANEAVRISTGAMVPPSCAGVVLQEDTAREGDTVRLTGTAPDPFNRHIRRAGLDFAEGRELLPAGTAITSRVIALGLAAGHSHFAVRSAPRVSLIDTGDELVAPGRALGPGELPASNGAMLAAMLGHLPVAVRTTAPVPDNLNTLLDTLQTQSHIDVIVTSGGASVGDHDLLQPALKQWGAEISFWKVAIKPGKPLLVARRGRQLVIGLPGNPVSAYVTARLFLLPVLRAMMGAAQPSSPSRLLPLAEALPPVGGRTEFLRAHWTAEGVVVAELQDSSALTSLALAELLIERPAGAPYAAVGTNVPVHFLDSGIA